MQKKVIHAEKEMQKKRATERSAEWDRLIKEVHPDARRVYNDGMGDTRWEDWAIPAENNIQ